MNKKIIFLDWDGTLCWSRFWESLTKTNPEFSKEIDNFFMFEKEMVTNWMRGKIGSEEINKFISQKTGFSESKLWQIFVSDCKNMKIDSEVTELIKKLKEKYLIVLVTGNMDCFTRFTVPELGLERFFDLIINSADIGYLKNEHNGKIFTDCLKRFNIDDMSKAYLLEDSEKVCNIFTKLGGQTMKINNNEDTIKYLKLLLTL